MLRFISFNNDLINSQEKILYQPKFWRKLGALMGLCVYINKLYQIDQKY